MNARNQLNALQTTWWPIVHDKSCAFVQCISQLNWHGGRIYESLVDFFCVIFGLHSHFSRYDHITSFVLHTINVRFFLFAKEMIYYLLLLLLLVFFPFQRIDWIQSVVVVFFLFYFVFLITRYFFPLVFVRILFKIPLFVQPNNLKDKFIIRLFTCSQNLDS